MRHHLILTNGRSGSNYVANYINLHPDALNYGEILGPWTPSRKLWNLTHFGGRRLSDYIDTILDGRAFFLTAQGYAAARRAMRREPLRLKRYRALRTIGFKDFHVVFRANDATDIIRERDDLAIVYLRRRNVLRRALSYWHLEASNEAAARGDKQVRRQKLTIDPDRVAADLDVIAGENRLLEDFVSSLSQHRIYRIDYEDYFASEARQADVNDELSHFLGLTPITARSDHRKILPTRLDEIVENYAEMAEALKGTPHEQWLN